MEVVQVTYLVPFLMFFAVACGPVEPVINVPAVDGVTADSATPDPPANATRF